MKNLTIISLALVSVFSFSCGNDSEYKTIKMVKMRVNHYQQPINQEEFFKGLSLLVQEGGEIGNEEWHALNNHIYGFEYDLGSIYDIVVLEKHLKNPLIDMSSIEYSLVQILSTEKVTKETEFEVILTIEYSNGFESYVIKNEFSEYTLYGSTKIDCGDLCDDLDEKIENKTGLIGTFTHVDNTTIKLINLKPNDI